MEHVDVGLVHVEIVRPKIGEGVGLLTPETHVLNLHEDPDVALEMDTLIVDYNVPATLTIPSPQASSKYRLYSRELTAADYLPVTGPDSLELAVDAGRKIYIRRPETTRVWEEPAGYFSSLDHLDTPGWYR